MALDDDRKNAFEGRFVHDAELRFKATARRNKLLGLWAADLLGKGGEQATCYAQSVVRADFEEVGEEDVFRKARADFDEAGVRQPDDQIREATRWLLQDALASLA